MKDLPKDPSASKSRLRLWLRLLDATRLIESEIRETVGSAEEAREELVELRRILASS